MNFKDRVKEIMLIEQQVQQSQDAKEGQQITIFLKALVDKNPNLSNEEILVEAEKTLGKTPEEAKPKVLSFIQQLREAKKIPLKKAKKPGFFKRVVLGILSPILSTVGSVAWLGSMFAPTGIKEALQTVVGFTMPINMAIGVGAQLASLRQNTQQQQGNMA